MGRIHKYPKSRSYDYVVVGAGSSGSVVASRLAEGAGNRVLLLEAGPSDRHVYIRMPAAFGMPLQSDRFNWFYMSEPEPGLDDRPIYQPRGRVLGGSSSINGMNWVRGNPWDYDNWAALGAKGWSYADVLPYFKRAETYDGNGGEYRGTNGPMNIETCPAELPVYRAFLEAGRQFGLPQVPDHNGYRQEGVHRVQRNLKNGIRCSTSEAYLRGGTERGNLEIVPRAFLTKIEFSGRRLVRVHADIRGKPHVIGVEGELILSGGAINSPQILMLSGIGDADHLREHGIAVIQHMPGVGANLKDHLSAPVSCKVSQDRYSVASKLSRSGRAFLALEWLLFKRGLGTSNFFEVGMFMRTSDEIKVPNIQVEFSPLIGEMVGDELKILPGFSYLLSLMRPKSVGKVWLRNADPKNSPAFIFNHLQEEEDQRQAIEAIKRLRALTAQDAWAQIRGVEVEPGPDVKSDAEILTFLRKHGGSNYHPACSCRMGQDDMSVVDHDARVHGFENLRVADVSIMPDIVTGNLNAPAVMIGEKVADLVRGRRLPREVVDYYRAQ